MEIIDKKKEHFNTVCDYRRYLYKNPDLRDLFLELTLRCNEHCMHCGSLCGDVPSEEMSVQQYHKILDDIKRDFDISKIMLCITGGEPLLRKDFFDIMGYANELGYTWGMTTNATLITKEIASKLSRCGMKTVSVSIDGLRDTHDVFRGLKGAYDKAMAGVDALLDEDDIKHVQITTVLHHSNVHELDQLYNIMSNVGIDSWRIVGVEPMGRARKNKELLLTGEDYRYLFDFIKEKRKENMPLTYGCSHFLGLDYECEVRDGYFLCGAGINVASIMSNGDIGACLDIERRPETIQGNIFRDDFKSVWENKFEIFRKDRISRSGKCQNCKSYDICAGGAYHSWDYDNDEQMVCFKNVLF